MQTSEQPKIKFLGVSVASVHLAAFKENIGEQKIDLLVDAKLFPREDGANSFRIWMTVEMRVPEFWEIKVAGFGDFEFGENVGEKEQEALINVNAPAIMFPYFRSFISTLTANCGGTVPVSIIPPHFFSGVLEPLTIPEMMIE